MCETIFIATKSIEIFGFLFDVKIACKRNEITSEPYVWQQLNNFKKKNIQSELHRHPCFFSRHHIASRHSSDGQRSQLCHHSFRHSSIKIINETDTNNKTIRRHTKSQKKKKKNSKKNDIDKHSKSSACFNINVYWITHKYTRQ